MVDRDDDLLIGMKTSAITFGRFDVAAIMICYVVFLVMMAVAGRMLGLDWQSGWPYYTGLACAALCVVYHYTLIRERDRMRCFKAFRHNNWLGAFVFAGTAAAYALR
jgi:4-hydroxybenzoate polyprenyltransferase